MGTPAGKRSSPSAALAGAAHTVNAVSAAAVRKPIDRTLPTYAKPRVESWGARRRGALPGFVPSGGLAEELLLLGDQFLDGRALHQTADIAGKVRETRRVDLLAGVL